MADSPADAHLPYDQPVGAPAAIILIAALSVLYGLCGLILIPLGVQWLLFGEKVPGAVEATVAHIRGDGILSGWAWLSTVPGMIAMLLLFVGGIGAFFCRPWARRWLIYGALVELCLAIIASYMCFRLVHGIRYGQVVGGDTAAAGALRFGLLYVISTYIFPVLLLICLNVKGVRAVFLRHAAASPPPIPESSQSPPAQAL